MSRPPRSLFTGLLVCCFVGLPACGGGGGRAPAPGRTVVDLVAGPQTHGGAEVFAVDVDAELFTAGGEYPVQWLRDGVAVHRLIARAVTARRLAMVAPQLASATYRVDVDLADAVGRLVVNLGEFAAVPDPSAYLAQVRAQMGSTVLALRDRAQADADAARRARRLADLAEVDAWLAAFDAARQSAAATELQQLANLFEANPLLRAVESRAGGQGEVIDEAQRLASIASDLAAARTLVDAGLPAAAAGLVPALAGAALQGVALTASGLLAVADGLARLDSAVGRAFRPHGDFAVEIGAGGVPARLLAGVPATLRGSAEFGSLAETDRSSLNPTIQRALGDLDFVNAAFVGIDPAVASKVASRPMVLPVAPLLTRAPVALSRVALVSSSNPLVTLSLADGTVTATLAGQTSAANTAAQFRYDAGSFGAVTGDVVLEVLALREDMLAIPAGTFAMGSNALLGAPYFGNDTQRPVHQVAVTRRFWMSRHEVTQAEWLALMGNSPSFFSGARRPVESVSWQEAMAYCAALTAAERAAGRVPDGYQYRLPTEAEWEYCCRAGSTTEFATGDDLLCTQAQFTFSYHGNAGCDVTATLPVGSFAANAFGLHDMHGNVAEWCLDGWDGSANYPAGAVSDPYVATGPYRAVRGGSWFDLSFYCRSAFRLNLAAPDLKQNRIGLRVVLAPTLVP